MKKTKIVATIGPSTWDKNIVSKMYKAGMNVVRINGAFADIEELKMVAKTVREVSNDIALMLDIKGHEVRLNKFPKDKTVKKGEKIIIGNNSGDEIYPVTYPALWKDLVAGQKIIIDKGEVELEVERIIEGKLHCKVISEGVIKPGKGMNLPGAILNNRPISKIDIEQMQYASCDDWDFISASFIRNANDIKKIRNEVINSKIKIIAKIEDQQGVDNIDEIIEEADGIMVARGDLGSEIDYAKIPIIQKEIIHKCNLAAKPVITATNMLESMVENKNATRAEISDIANAILDGTDAIMTSAETTIGKHPVRSIETMSKIAMETEKHLPEKITENIGMEQFQIHLAMSEAAFEFVHGFNEVTKILVFSQYGLTPRILARYNLKVPIIAFVKTDILKRQLLLSKNVSTYKFDKEFIDRDSAITEILNKAFEVGAINKQDKVVVIGNCHYSKSKKINYPNVFEYVDVANFID